MTSRAFDPLRLDVAAFATEAATLEGQWPLRTLPRLAEATVPDGGVEAGSDAGGDADSDAIDGVAWRARGERVPQRGGEAQPWLQLKASTRLALECQRCLKPVGVAVSVERRILFVAGEDQAAELDADSEDDVLALSRAFDLRALVEDELLLALPLVPRHEVCPEPLRQSADEVVIEPEPSPFAALASLKRGSALN